MCVQMCSNVLLLSTMQCSQASLGSATTMSNWLAPENNDSHMDRFAPPDVCRANHNGPMIFNKSFWCSTCTHMQPAEQEWWALGHPDRHGICRSGDWMCVPCYARNLTNDFYELKECHNGTVKENQTLRSMLREPTELGPGCKRKP